MTAEKEEYFNGVNRLFERRYNQMVTFYKMVMPHRFSYAITLSQKTQAPKCDFQSGTAPDACGRAAQRKGDITLAFAVSFLPV